jgi:hypothetical protein
MSKAARRRPLLMASVMAALVAASIAALVVASMKPAEAAFPGRNGAIVFTDHFEVHRVQPDGTQATPLADQLGYSQNPAFSADGKKIAFQNDEDDIDDILAFSGSGAEDRIRCGEGFDVAEADKGVDRVEADCERVYYRPQG